MKISLSPKKGRLFTLFFLLLLTFFVTSLSANAQTGGNTWTEKVTCTRFYDQYSEILYANNNQAINGSCTRNYVYRVYQGDKVEVKIEFNPANAPANVNQSYDGYLTNNGGFSAIFSGYQPGQGNPAPQITLNTLGNNLVKIRFFNTLTNQYEDEIFLEFEVIPKVDVWVEAPEICPADFINSGQDYHFNIKTSVNLNNIMRSAALAPMGAIPSGGCNWTERIDVGIESALNGLVHGVSHLYGSTFNPSTATDPVDHYINYSDMVGILTPSQMGIPINLDIHFTDGIRDFHIQAPIPVKSDVTNTADPANNIPAASYHFYDYTVQGNEVWTPANNPSKQLYGTGGTNSTLRIQHKLNIPVGTTLRVQNMNVEFGPMATTVLNTEPGKGEYGGYLKLDNATFTAFHPCGSNDSVWEGIIVMGDNTKNQEVQNSTTGQRWQGTLEMINNSTLSYAHEAVMACDVNDVNHKSGGVVIATNSTFYNNCRSVALNNYKWQIGTGVSAIILPYRANFSNCDFKVDRAIKYNFRGFITGWQVRGAWVQGCRFKNISGVATPYNYGLYGTDFGLVVDKLGSIPCEFYNMKQAVRIDNVSGTSTVNIKSAKFYNNDTSIIMTDITAPVIKANEVNVPKGNAFIQKVGMLFQGGKSYVVNDNILQSTAAYRNTGVLVTSGGSAANEIKRNTYSNLTTGNLSNFINRGFVAGQPFGLQFLCNSHTANTYDMAARGNSAATNGMRASQGAATIPAADAFNGGASHLYDIYNPSNEVGAVNYFYSSSAGPSHNPSLNYGSVSKTTVGPQENCADAPKPSGPIGNGGSQFVAQQLNYYMTDETGMQHRDSLYYWVHQMQEPAGALINVDLLLEDGDINTANSVYNGIVGTYGLTGVEAAEYSNYGRSLMNIRIAQIQNGKSLIELDGSQVTSLANIAANAQLWAKFRAQSWLTLYDGRTFANTLLFPEDAAGSGRQLGTEEQQSAANLFPNPVKDQLQVSYSNSSEDGSTLQITDLTGRLLISKQLAGKGGLETIDVRTLVPGIYLYRILDDKTVMTNGKIVKE
jgi:hypothetical protein